MALLDEFVDVSSELCGLSPFTLRGTGFAEGYYRTVVDIVGQDVMDRLLAGFAHLPVNDTAAREEALRVTILADAELGPVARNIIKLWYVSTWFELPAAWKETFGAFGSDRTYIPFTYAYPESLLFPAIGSHPAGAKPQGYGSWTEPPQILEFTGETRL
jgi:hypothetical protein